MATSDKIIIEELKRIIKMQAKEDRLLKAKIEPSILCLHLISKRVFGKI
jgi:hypothetical protein